MLRGVSDRGQFSGERCCLCFADVSWSYGGRQEEADLLALHFEFQGKQVNDFHVWLNFLR